MTDALLLCTCPDAADAARIARALVEARLAACVSRLDGLVSTYRWEGGVQEDGEVLLLIKTTQAAFAPLRERLLALHPYDVPELIAVPVERGHDAYLDWLRQSVQA